MRRPSHVVASLGIATAISACGGTAGDPVVSDTERSPITPSAAEVASAPPGPNGIVPPVLAWTFADSVVPAAGDVELTLFGGHDLGGAAVTFDGRTGFAATEVLAPITTTSSFSVSAWVSLTASTRTNGRTVQGTQLRGALATDVEELDVTHCATGAPGVRLAWPRTRRV